MGWSVEGCWVSYTSENYTVCSCSHLSTFALILQIAEVPTVDEPVRTIPSPGWPVCVCFSCVLWFFSLNQMTASWTCWTRCASLLGFSFSACLFSPSSCVAGTQRSTTQPVFTSASTPPPISSCCYGMTNTWTSRYSNLSGPPHKLWPWPALKLSVCCFHSWPVRS